MDLRKKERRDYRLLHSGGTIPVSHAKVKEDSVKWSTSQFYELEVIDERDSPAGPEVLVHYVGWDDHYNEWKPRSEVVDIKHSSDALELLKQDLLVQIKENLNTSRVRDTEITVSISVQTETFEHFVTVIEAEVAEERRGIKIYRPTVRGVTNFLGADWHYRIVNKAGDFAYVLEDTLQLWLRERRCLEEFIKVGDSFVKKPVHRGHLLSFRFVKNRGNKHELHQIGL